MMPAVYDTLILSDVHLGSEISRAEAATRMLKETRFRRLILLGDIFCDLNFRRLTKAHWKFLGQIRKLSNPKRGIEVVWVEGNHDQGLVDVLSHLVGVPAYQEYGWEFLGRRHLAIHGHQFDRFAINNLLVSNVLTFLHLQLQKLDTGSKRISRYMDLMNTRWLRMGAKVSEGALAHAKFKRAERIFCGHTHVPLFRERDGIEYYNSGSWTDATPTYITVDAEGVRIHEYQERPDHCDTGEERVEADSELADLADESGLLEDAQYESVGG
jgi:UDP-2,3-diacylglucosamine pyrophosphatase LpxH